MKILHVITRSDTIGGAQRHVLDLAKGQKDIGKHTVWIASADTGVFKESVESSGISYVPVKYIRRNLSFYADIKALFALRTIISQLSPDVVALHSVKAGLLGRIAAFGIGKTVVFTAHGWSHIRASSSLTKLIYIFLERLLSRFSTQIICVSQSDLLYATSVIKIDKCKVTKVVNGVLSKQISGCSSSKYDCFRFLSVVRFQEPKDFKTLLDSLSRIRHLEWKLTLAGDGPDLSSVCLEVQRLGLSDRVTFAGFVDDLSLHYSQCDAVILISKSEGLPMSLVEAMSYKKPLIASCVGGIPELILDGVNGFLIPTQNSEILAERLEYLLSLDVDELNSFGLASYNMFEASYSYKTMYEKTMSVYGDL